MRERGTEKNCPKSCLNGALDHVCHVCGMTQGCAKKKSWHLPAMAAKSVSVNAPAECAIDIMCLPGVSEEGLKNQAAAFKRNVS